MYVIIGVYMAKLRIDTEPVLNILRLYQTFLCATVVFSDTRRAALNFGKAELAIYTLYFYKDAFIIWQIKH